MARFAVRDLVTLTNVQGNMMSTDGLSGPVAFCTNIYVMYHLNIWKFGRDRSRNEIWTKNILSGHGDFFPHFDKKSQISRFGRDLAEVWNIQMYLDI
jgi:hypothetical protein